MREEARESQPFFCRSARVTPKIVALEAEPDPTKGYKGRAEVEDAQRDQAGRGEALHERPNEPEEESNDYDDEIHKCTGTWSVPSYRRTTLKGGSIPLTSMTS